ncbi:hypothetical protein QQY66_36920 [Streptomyces sp. DG2A-72]|uniref:hypothetical protein n=1 Tax=Streptomyces sp. DG2A-72 TaxID=3051386 RepID=UPI00265C635A|nr:hypothetical protein [Streptomyces sp. DG2A-72]MDO0937029.1 hypothetical protein [Streptomyces sp. DG2A-72]
MSGFTGRLAVSCLAACGALAITASPAAASSKQDFDVCAYTCSSNSGFTYGTITWYNRTAGITGSVWDNGYKDVPTVAYFEAYAGSVKIDSETRTANTDTDLGAVRGFNFTIGDTNLVGGIDRIKITACEVYSATQRLCSASVNYNK